MVPVLLFGCEPDQERQKMCLAYYSNHGVKLTFDGSALVGKELQIKSDGNLVYDTCQGGGITDGRREYQPNINGSASVITQLISREVPLPVVETLEILERSTCSDIPVLAGSVTVNYAFEYHPEDKDCDHDYYTEEQTVVFQ